MAERIDRAKPHLVSHGEEIQRFGNLSTMPNGLSDSVCAQSVEALNKVLADSITIRDLYKKCHWQVSGPTFYQLHLLFDKHFEEQEKLVDALAERIQILGGISISMAHDVAETTTIPRPPKGREAVSTQISRLAHAHEMILQECRKMAKEADERGDPGTNDLLVSEVVRTNEMQVWFVSEHLVEMPLTPSSMQV